jgi:hypothetical protein
MKFIIPQNYAFKSKAFGIIPYSTLIFNVIWYVLIFSILHLFISNWNIKLFLLISFAFPITLLSVIGLNGESFIYVLQYIIKYFIKPKVYIFKKY